ncbi:ABC transporter permease subunit [Microbacterium sp. NPDC019599]|uniref:ABC transporter permease n=1 Tax=Microbacterium sp. NPDC019599 TaxID=3154690 RepID=UPI0033FC09B4
MRSRGIQRTVLRSTGYSLVSIVVILLLWQAVVSLTGISPYVAKGPLQVFEHLFTGEDAAENRAELAPLLAQTMQDAAIGFVVGMLAAIALAIAFSLSKAVEAGVMPLALLLRSVPLVALAPVIILITGRGSTASVAVIGSIVVLFPALASVLYGLSRATPQSLDLVHVYGGMRATAMRKVNFPGAAPSLFAAARVSVPGAVTGALLAEWLSTGTGIGGMIQKFSASARFDDLWASVAVITLLTLVLYNVVQIVENAVLAQLGMSTRLT